MNRLPLDADDRAGLIAELTQQRLRAWNWDVQNCIQSAMNVLHKVVLPKLTKEEVEAIFTQAVADRAGAESRFNLLRMKAMRAAAEAEVTSFVDEMACGRKIIPSADNSTLLAQLADRATGSAA